jgi:hypothetical protein
MLSQKFQAEPKGLIKSALGSYSIDEQTGEGTASYDGTAGIFIFTKEFKGSVAFKLDPLMLKSENVKKGMVVKSGNLTLTVKDVVNNVAQIEFQVSGAGQVHGVASLDLSKEFISIAGAEVFGNVLGYDIDLPLSPAAV